MHRSFHDFKRFMDKSGLSASQVSTLMRLYHQRACGVTDIGLTLGITNAAASQLVDKLVGLGLIDRTEDIHDRRVRQITLTEQGRHLIQEGMTAWRGWMEDLTTTLSKDELEAITNALKLLTEASRRLEGGSISEVSTLTSEERLNPWVKYFRKMVSARSVKKAGRISWVAQNDQIASAAKAPHRNDI
jgi:DNA-binding MarR family transcriptional regulator